MSKIPRIKLNLIEIEIAKIRFSLLSNLARIIYGISMPL